MLSLKINDKVKIPFSEIEFSSSKSGGPGGQHVNTTNSRVTLRFNVKTSEFLTEYEKKLILTNIPSKITAEGDILIHASSNRSQLRNKDEVILRLSSILAAALKRPKIRVATKLSRNKKARRLDNKKRQSLVKKSRSRKDFD